MRDLLLIGAVWTVPTLLFAAAVVWRHFARHRDLEDNAVDLDRRRGERPHAYVTNHGRVLDLDEARARARCFPRARLEGRGTVRNYREGAK